MEDRTDELSNKTFRTRQLPPLHNFLKDSLVHKEKLLSRILCQHLDLKDSARSSRHKKDIRGEIKNLTIAQLPLPNLPTYDPALLPIRVRIEIYLFTDAVTYKHEFVLLPAMHLPKIDLDIINDIAFYPLLLLRAASDVTDSVLYWLENAYLAPARPFVLPNTTLVNIVHICVESFYYLSQEMEERKSLDPKAIVHDLEDDTDQLKLEYQLLNDDVSKITLLISRQQVVDICHQLPERALFYKAFLNHVCNTTSIRVSSMTFSQVAYSSLAVRRDGCFKINPNALKDDALDLLRELLQAGEEQAYEFLY
ncbi:uncharacterized protein B0P05DRAFT_550656 [Gilbertella persicaria]|uniref:uncharacterized protein n=1 Tax=Gilbertella persicaria TaxID=101096 RepID=UPI00221F6332|nr:uncharacterized protein B0P05DRAFT_550656 [Gilbertella persicaria]KAI8069742.1 hypothetical protein B0P05DRAFT_550656 [Gilbertella persicaria]